MMFSHILQKNRFWHFMQIVSFGDNFHEMSKPVFWEKKNKQENNINMSPAEFFDPEC